MKPDAEPSSTPLARNQAVNGLGSWVKRGVKAVSHRAGLPPAIQHFAPSKSVILLYHKVQRRPFGLWGEEALNVTHFEEHLRYLTRHFELVSLHDVVHSLQRRTPLPKCSVAITFDDGYRNNWVLAAPLLKKFRVPATFFVTTGLVGTSKWMWAYELEEIFLRFSIQDIAQASRHLALQRLCEVEPSKEKAWEACVAFLKTRPHHELVRTMESLRKKFTVHVDDENQFLSWDEVRALENEGFDLGAHSVHHPILPRLSQEEAQQEIIGSKQMLSDILHQPPRFFAYPNGDFHPRISELVGASFEASFSTLPQACSDTHSLFQLPRVSAPASVADLSFELTRHFLRKPKAKEKTFGDHSMEASP